LGSPQQEPETPGVKQSINNYSPPTHVSNDTAPVTVVNDEETLVKKALHVSSGKSTQSKTVKQHLSSAHSKADTQLSKPCVLQGFIPRGQRAKLDAIYISGITTEGTSDQVASSLEDYATQKGKFVRSVKIVKQKGNTMAAKMVVKCDDVDSLVMAKFWPLGINVRKWVNTPVS